MTLYITKMNYNYLMNTFDGSVGCEISSSDSANSSNIYNGRIKNEVDESSSLRSLSVYKHPIKVNNPGNLNLSICQETNSDDKKLKFSERLKVLLKNGGIKNSKTECSDPYAFSDIESQNKGSLTKALNNVELYIGKDISTNLEASNGSMQKNNLLKRAITQHSSNCDSVNEKDCNGETKNNLCKSIKLAKFAVPTFESNNYIATDFNQTAFKLQPCSTLKQNKVQEHTNGRTPDQVQLPSNHKPVIDKLIGKSKLQSIKPPNINNPLKINKTAGMTLGFVQSHAIKQGNLKAEKKSDLKHKSFQKGKSLLNQIQKTALLNRPGNQTVRKNTTKSCVFGMNKGGQKHLDGLHTLHSAIKNNGKKSLLEESLLGLKNPINDKNLNNVATMKSRTTETNELKLSETVNAITLTPPNLRTDSLNQGKHESLERIWNLRNKLKGLKREHDHFGLTINDGEYDENPNSECLLFQNYWFSICGDYDSLSSDRRRDTKLSQLKIELRHKIRQLQWRYKDEYRDKVVELLVDSARKQPNLTAFLIRLENSKFNNRKKRSRIKPFNLLRPVMCGYVNPESGRKCEDEAMPCVKFCQQHITQSNDQLLFTSCSALRSDNTSCQAAVLNQSFEVPLCLQHKRLVNMPEMPKKLIMSKPVNRPSQPRKRSRSSTCGSSRSGRNKKRKRSSPKGKREILNGFLTSNNSSISFDFGKEDDNNGSCKNQNSSDKVNPQIISRCDVDESQDVEVGEVLSIAADLPLELATQATKLLEEHDFTNVLSHIPADAFNDLFTEDKEEYEPTPQETEELERALEAVDKDVKSLEKLSQTQGILETLLDEQTIAQTLAQLPGVTSNVEVPQTLVPVFYQNGFSNINQLEQTLQDVNKSLTQTVLLNQGGEAIGNHFNNLTVPNHADLLQS